MTARRQILRRVNAALARTGAVGSAVMVILTVAGMTMSHVPEASAATDAGPAQVVTPFDGSSGAGQPLASGGSATVFSLYLPVGAACTGDSANDGYRVQSYMVLAATDPSTLTFSAAGPLPTGLGATFGQPLYEVTSTAYLNAQTANATTVGGPGPVIGIPAFSLGQFVPGNVPPGAYNVGIACTKGPASATQLDKYWNTRITVAADAADQPAGVTWTASQVPTTTTTASTTTTPSTSSTSGPGPTTTTAIGDTTATTAGTLAASGGLPSGTFVLGSVSQLPVTGGSTTSLVVWSVLLLMFGRMAVLLGRPVRVKPALPA